MAVQSATLRPFVAPCAGIHRGPEYYLLAHSAVIGWTY